MGWDPAERDPKNEEEPPGSCDEPLRGSGHPGGCGKLRSIEHGYRDAVKFARIVFPPLPANAASSSFRHAGFFSGIIGAINF